ncbi:MAG TPA: TerB family tellurite resistance protein [Thermoanaerobaculia bacterium]|nr:TerB family tellurite resistance protein [Thermoanaerobaculia bacterium]
MSFASLIHRFRNGLQPDGGAADKTRRHDPLTLATAAVLLDIAYADGELTAPEHGDMVGFLTRAFALTGELAQELIEAAEEIRDRTIDHFALTSYIRRHASLEERIDIVKTMWRMVYSDGRLTDYENYLVRKLADLLGLEHHVMIEAKVAVLQERGAVSS